MSQLAKPTLSAAKHAVLQALYEHLHSDAPNDYLEASEIRSFLDIPISEKFLSLVFQELYASEYIRNKKDSLSFRITAKGVQNVERTLRAVARSADAPASDRIVPLNHNSSQELEVENALESLEESVRSDNEAFLSEPADREVAIAEISALRRLWAANLIRVDAFKEQARVTLAWISAKASAAAIAEACKHVLKLILGWS